MGAEVGLTDERLVSLSRNGDLSAFNSLVERYQSLVYRLCLRLLGNREAAEDATQETFLSAFRALPRFSGSDLRPWLVRIAANHAKDEWRRRRRHAPTGSLDQMFEALEMPVEIGDPGPGPELSFERQELAGLVQAALLDLPFDQRQAVLLVDLEEYRYEEVARITGASLGTVKSRVHRGREHLRQVFAARPELLAAYRRLDRGGE
jgi:RNA polymerase sigma-70 factor (ECF subfamily)